jgi:adenylate cyclase
LGDGSPPSHEGTGDPDIFSELKRRKVYRAGAAYLAIAFAVVEGADLVFPTLGIGPGVFNALVLVSLLGFPMALGLAWTFDFTGGGIIRTEPAGEDSLDPVQDRWVRAKAALVGAGFVAVVWVGVRAWQTPQTTDGPSVPTDIPVLAVLPFEDFSPEGDQAYFADGLHEELLHQLSMVRGIQLISRTSVAHFRGSPAVTSVIADSLGARYVLEGSVRRSLDSIQVTLQLIDAASDNHLWSESHSAALSLGGIFGLQELLATRVAASLGGTLAARTGQTLGTPPTSNLEAYHAFLRGLYHWAQFSMESIQMAIDDFNQAVQLDPEFGRAHAKLAMLYAVLNNFSGGIQGQLLPLVQRHAELAIRYLPDNPDSHLAMMSVHWPIEWNWEAARQDLETILSMDPDYVDAWWALAEWHGVIAGDTERGLKIIREAERLDPFSVQPLAVRGWILWSGRRFEEAADVFRRVVELTPEDPTQTRNLISTLALSGQQEEASQRLEQLLSRIPGPVPVDLAVPMAQVGDTAAARELVREAAERKAAGGDVAASSIAAGYAAVGEVEEALDWLEFCFENEGGIYYLRKSDWDSLRDHPRFKALWNRLGLPGSADGE